MNILVTGAKGMVGTALVNNLKNIKDGKNKTRPNIIIDEIFEYDIESSEAELEEYCQKADFVFNLAGVNRPKFEVSGDKIEAVHMIPGWTHNIINLSDTEDLVTVMTCNEIFNPNKPDTFFEEV